LRGPGTDRHDLPTNDLAATRGIGGVAHGGAVDVQADIDVNLRMRRRPLGQLLGQPFRDLLHRGPLARSLGRVVGQNARRDERAAGLQRSKRPASRNACSAASSAAELSSSSSSLSLSASGLMRTST